MVGHDANGINVSRHQIGRLIVNVGVFLDDIVEAFFGSKVQHLFVAFKKISLVFQIQIHQPMPFERFTGMAQGIGAIEG
jgi:hypothetical protein